MVRPPCFDINGIKSGVWSKEEDDTLRGFVQKHGHHNWQKLPFLAGLKRSGKSCRLRWVNYLQPGLKKGDFSKEEVDLIIKLHNQLGNRWAAIAEKLPGRSDNDIKNQWHAHIKKRSKRTRAEMGAYDEEHSFEIINSCKKSNHQQETTNAEAQGITFDDHTLIFTQFNIEQEFSDFGSCHNGTPTFSDDDTCFSQLNIDLPPLFPEEEFYEMGAYDEEQSFEISCYNKSNHQEETPGFNVVFSQDSCAENTTNFEAYDYRFFSTDDVPPFPEEEFSTFGLCNNDTPTFSGSSDGGIDDHTFFTQFNIDLPVSDFGLCHNDTPPFSDSSDGMVLW